MTQLTLSLIPRQLSQRRVRLYVDCVNAELDSMSTESKRNDGIFVKTGTFLADSVERESHSASTRCLEDELSQHRYTRT
jgi:hypothetical protein